MNHYYVILFSVVFIHQCSAQQDPDGIVVSTFRGKVRGSAMTSSTGRIFYAFRGIPYAEPPIGSLRFSDPLPIRPWNNVFDATNEGPSCIQLDTTIQLLFGQEDCLRLNVYTSNPLSNRLRPVMVFIHGGLWYFGSGNGQTYFYGPQYFMNYDVVIVTINYRLGIFGFLSTESPEAPGNYGLLDQIMALQWVQENIARFGGDPNSVTAFGETAGATSIHLQILSPRSEGLFHRAIMETGSGICSWATSRYVGRYTQMVADAFHCKGRPNDVLDCLRQVNATDLANSRRLFEIMPLFPLAFLPRIDVERKYPVIPKRPVDLLFNGEFYKIPVIMGVAKNDSSFFYEIMFLSGLVPNLSAVLPKLVQLASLDDFNPQGPIRSQEIIHHYIGNNTPTYWDIEKLFGDETFYKCIRDTSQVHAYFNSTYIYYYNYRGAFSLPLLINFTAFDLGVSHRDEIFEMWLTPQFGPFVNENDATFSVMLTQLWTSFAISGKPSASVRPVDWQPTRYKKPRYLNLTLSPNMVDSDYLFADRLPFWAIIYRYAV